MQLMQTDYKIHYTSEGQISDITNRKYGPIKYKAVCRDGGY